MPVPLSAYDEPEDTVDAIFIARAVEQIGNAAFPDDDQRREKLHRRVAQALESGELQIVVRHFEEKSGLYGIVHRAHRTPEGWLEVVETSQLEEIDQRPGIPVGQRRRVPVPHWAFVKRKSLAKFLVQFKGFTAAQETRAVEHLADVLRAEPNMRKEDAREALGKYAVSGEGFEKRVWPQGRAAAGLPPKANPGAKPRPRAKESDKESRR